MLTGMDPDTDVPPNTPDGDVGMHMTTITQQTCSFVANLYTLNTPKVTQTDHHMPTQSTHIPPPLAV